MIRWYMLKRYREFRARHRVAWRVVRLAVLMLVILGWFHARAMHWPLWHGEFCALANGVTDGCDSPPASRAAYIVCTLEYCIVVPLLAATFSFFITSATAEHVKKQMNSATAEIKAHTERRIKHHLGIEHDEVKP